MVNPQAAEQLRALETVCLHLATNRLHYSYEDYEAAWGAAMSNPAVGRYLPDWLVECRAGSHFWAHMKSVSPQYQPRRDYLQAEFSAVLKRMGRAGVEVTAASVAEMLADCTAASVHEAWHKCIERRLSDPEGAITAARTMLEATCKIILERLGKVPDTTDLLKLYKQAAGELKLSPDQHTEQLFKQILSGCGTVVNGLAALRNALSDAHGQGLTKVKPARRHAELAVNLAGTLCAFLMATYEERQRPAGVPFSPADRGVGASS